MKKIIFGLVFINICFGDIAGIYQMPKNNQGKESIVEIFQRDNMYYGVGFSSKNGDMKDALDSNNPDKSLRSRHISGSVFLWLDCKETECSGHIYSFEKGKTYPTLVSLKENELTIKIDVFFGPTFKWKKLNAEEMAPFLPNKLDTTSLDISKH